MFSIELIGKWLVADHNFPNHSCTHNNYFVISYALFNWIYCKRGKISRDKHSQFQPYKVFHEMFSWCFGQ